MRTTRRFALLLMMTAATAAAAQGPGAAVFQAKCQTCHGADGLASSGVGKIMKVKPVTDPSVKAMSEEQMIAVVRNGSGKMQAYKDSLSDAQIRDAVEYFRTLIK
jgi:cytochrome c6